MKDRIRKGLVLTGCLLLLLAVTGCRAGEKPSSSSSEASQPSQTEPVEILEQDVPLQAQPAEETEQQLCDRYTAWFYARGELLLEQFEQLKSAALLEANQKPQEEWDKGYLAGIAIEFLADAYGLVEQCDADVADGLAQMELDLDKIGGNPELVELFRESYRTAREQAISNFMQQFKNLA